MAKWKVLRIEKRSGNKMDLDYTYFSGVEDGISSAFEKLAEVFEYQVFELCVGEEYLIPYMMNDAVENYLILKNGQMIGNYLNDDTIFHSFFARHPATLPLLFYKYLPDSISRSAASSLRYRHHARDRQVCGRNRSPPAAE